MPHPIALARHRLRISQSELAYQAGVSLRTLQGWERGKRPADLAALLRVASLLGLPPQALLGGGEKKSP